MAWTYIATVVSESDPENKTYQIRRAGTGRLGCSCPRYQFAKGEKTCKHLKAYQAGHVMDEQNAVKPTVRQESVRIVSGGETFVIRRAIAFGEVR